MVFKAIGRLRVDIHTGRGWGGWMQAFGSHADRRLVSSELVNEGGCKSIMQPQ